MTGIFHFQLKSMRRRARLFARQIALAAVLTALAAGFIGAALIGGTAGDRDRGQIASSIGGP